MKPQKQAFRHNPPEQLGDCHRTAIACLLDLERDDVPHLNRVVSGEEFAQFYRDFLRTFGLECISLPVNATEIEQVFRMQASLNPAIYYILGGRSRNGTNHSVIARGAEIIWDPSIDDSGIVGPCDDGFFWIEYLTPFYDPKRGAAASEAAEALNL